MANECNKESSYFKAAILASIIVGSLILIAVTSFPYRQERNAKQIQSETGNLLSTTSQYVTTTETTTTTSESLERVCPECPTCAGSEQRVWLKQECPKKECPKKECPTCPTTYVPRKKDRFAFGVCSKSMKILLGKENYLAIYKFKEYLKKVQLLDDFCAEMNTGLWRNVLKVKEKTDGKKNLCQKREKCTYDIHSCGPVCLNYDFGVCS